MERREEILAVAHQSFMQNGELCGVDAIAQKLGLAKGTIYLYFPSKEDLVAEVAKRAVTRHLEGLRMVAAGSAGPEERLAAMLRTSLAFVDEHRLVLRLLLEVSSELRSVVRRVWLKPARALFRTVLDEGVRDGIFRAHDSVAIAHCAMSLARGSLFYEGSLSVDEFAQEAATLLVLGISKSNSLRQKKPFSRSKRRSSR